MNKDILQIIESYCVHRELQLPTFVHTCKKQEKHCDCLAKFAKLHRIKCLTPYKRIARTKN